MQRLRSGREDAAEVHTRVQGILADILGQAQPQQQSVAPSCGLVGPTRTVALRAEHQVRLTQALSGQHRAGPADGDRIQLDRGGTVVPSHILWYCSDAAVPSRLTRDNAKWGSGSGKVIFFFASGDVRWIDYSNSS